MVLILYSSSVILQLGLCCCILNSILRMRYSLVKFYLCIHPLFEIRMKSICELKPLQVLLVSFHSFEPVTIYVTTFPLTLWQLSFFEQLWWVTLLDASRKTRFSWLERPVCFFSVVSCLILFVCLLVCFFVIVSFLFTTTKSVGCLRYGFPFQKLLVTFPCCNRFHTC